MLNEPVPPSPVLDYLSPRERVCPGCGTAGLYQPSFTWWGGAIGHRVMGIEKCPSCKRWWVKKTGQPGGARIAIYTGAGVVLGIIFTLLFFLAG